MEIVATEAEKLEVWAADAVVESTSRGVDWWHRYYARVGVERRAGRVIYHGPWTRIVAPTVSWIDDRNEAAALGVSVDELLESRRVADTLRGNADFSPTDELHATIRIQFAFDVSTPRYHGQVVRIGA